ncbi:MAG: dihydrolipoyl dehydrogenase [Phycisphaerae bacterium]|jgi:dihydrolipoamide dehydrogenase|nr:MAG: dihydrolipoyl dehydrogenase [Phycisphaerae bacterium]
MSDNNSFDVIVIGAGPGGYVCAIRAAQLGLKTACVEREYLGGTCLNVGCIPSKALLDSSEKFVTAKNKFSKHGIEIESIKLDLKTMISRKDGVVKALTSGIGMLFRKNKVTHLSGTASIPSPGTVRVTTSEGSTKDYKTRHIVIATGSAPSPVPSVPFDGKYVLSSTEILNLTELPQKLIVIGGGYIGVEMSSVWSRLGSQVQILEFLDGILPASDREMAGALQKSLEKQGLLFRFNTLAEGVKVENNKVKLSWKSRDGQQSGTEEADKVLVCVGRRPVTDGLGLETLGVAKDKKGFIQVDSKFQTNVSGIYAIGDVIGGIMLAHKAEEEGVAVAELLAGKPGHVNYATCPAVVYTHPELASVGKTEEELKAAGVSYKVGKFNVIANGRARGMDETEGFFKVLADAKTDRILGVHILSAHASDVICEAVTAMEFHASAEDLARTFHAHPTLSECLKEACLAVDKMQIHS